LWQSRESSGSFSSLDCGVVRIGEETGRLNDSLGFLRDYYFKKTEQKRTVSSATTYPVIILFTAVVVVVFMMAFIVPMFDQVYSRMGSELPALTKTIISVSNKMPFIITCIVAVTAVVVLICYTYKNNERYEKLSAAFLLFIPVAGSIIRKNNQAHICKLLYLLTASGVPLLTGLNMLSEIISFYPYSHSLKSIAEGIQKGESLSANLEAFPDLYDSKLVVMLRVGEESNRLPEMLDKQSDDLTRLIEFKLKRSGSILEPIMILFVGIVVAVILISMYLPMFKLGGVMN
ncbi:MAG: type II secretion system F family protein, partial [Rikenellaceae bacterium]|nr:type II secretion system F family protein [Rikenellaceae bacterium]